MCVCSWSGALLWASGCRHLSPGLSPLQPYRVWHSHSGGWMLSCLPYPCSLCSAAQLFSGGTRDKGDSCFCFKNSPDSCGFKASDHEGGTCLGAGTPGHRAPRGSGQVLIRAGSGDYLLVDERAGKRVRNLSVPEMGLLGYPLPEVSSFP